MPQPLILQALFNQRLQEKCRGHLHLQDDPQQQQEQPGGAAANGQQQEGVGADACRRALFLEMLPGELEYTALQLAVAPRNESAWNYLLGLFSFPGATPHEMGRHKEVRCGMRRRGVEMHVCRGLLLRARGREVQCKGL